MRSRTCASAQAATDQAFEDVMDFLAVGQTERQVARELEHLLRRDGADGLAFDSIVAFGENAAEPHHEPSHRLLEEGDVIKMDFGALWEGYHADMTRTIAFGIPGHRAEEDPRRGPGGPAGRHRHGPSGRDRRGRRRRRPGRDRGRRVRPVLPARPRSRRGLGDPRGAAAGPGVRSTRSPRARS